MQTKQLGRLPVVHFAAGGVVTPADAALMTRIGHNFSNHETLGIGLSFLISAVSVGLDLSRNYINGTVPRTFGLLRIKLISLLGNRISGSIPEEIANISTLEELVLEDNQLGGLLPQNLGSMSSLRRLFLSANNFTGTIPETFGGLKTLIDFRIDGSELSRKIGDFIRNWTNITRLDLQGTSMEGTIPSNILHLPFEKPKRVEDI